jgi:nucleotide-binding universal stress UspA family protein/ABC-type transporter Mla MlaB component
VRRSRELLAGVARGLDQPAEIRIAFGEPAERLIALAQREAAEFIVVAASHQALAKTLLLGSVYLALAGAGPCPVLVVPPNVERMRPGGPIVCGVDGAEPSRVAARLAAELACRLDARLKLVYATGVQPAAASAVRGGYMAVLPPPQDAAVRMPQDAAEGLPGTKPAYLLVEQGPAAERLRDVAERESAQLLVAGARGSGQSAEALLRSVASALAANAARPLVIVPPKVRPRRDRHAVIVATRRLRNSAVLQVHGELDCASAIELERQGARMLDEAGGRLVLDLSDATVADSAEAHLTDRLARRASELGAA